MQTKNSNEIIRIKKSPKTFAVISKSFLEDENLSWKAKGILAYLLTKPDNWKVIIGDLVNRSTDGKTAIYSALKELKEQGYYIRKPIRNEKGYFIHWENTIYECPEMKKQKQEELEKKQKKSEEKQKEELKEKTKESSKMGKVPIFSPLLENPEMDNSEMKNQTFNNNYNINNNCSNKDFKSNLSSFTKSAIVDKADKEQDIETYIKQIKNNIRYQDLYSPDSEMLLNVVVNNMVDIITSDTNTVIIGGVKKPLPFVKKIFLKLKYDNIAGVLQRFRATKTKIKNVRQYLLTCIFNAGLEDGLTIEKAKILASSNSTAMSIAGYDSTSNAFYNSTIPIVACNNTLAYNNTMLPAAYKVVRPEEKKNKFNDFPQRQYSKEDFNVLERKLLEKRLKIATD